MNKVKWTDASGNPVNYKGTKEDKAILNLLKIFGWAYTPENVDKIKEICKK